jgi:predicted enzyme related to lactoylglutathione lyase
VDGVAHFEIPAEDLARAKQFYAEAFGWEAHTMPMGDGTEYTTVTTIPVDPNTMMPTRPGSINGGLVERSEAMPAPVITIGVTSIDDALQKVISSGGSVVAPRTEVSGGAFAYFRDSERNLMGLWETAT